MSRNWIAPLLAGLLAIVGCGETNRLDEARDPAPPVEDQYAASPDDELGETGEEDEVVFDDDTEIAPQHVLRPDIDGEQLEPLDADDLSPEAVTTPESTPERRDTGSDAIEESLLDDEQIDSQDLEDRLDRALDLDEPPPADVPSETTETLRPEDRPIRDEPATATPVLEQEELGEEIAPEVPEQSAGEPDADQEEASDETAEDKQASTDLITKAVAEADEEIGEAAGTLEKRIEETLEEAAPDESADQTPPSLPLEDPDAATEPADRTTEEVAPTEGDAGADESREIEARKPLLDTLPTAATDDEVFTARAFVAADKEALQGQEVDNEIKKVERELAAMRKSLTAQRMNVGEAAVHLNSLQHNLQLLREAESEDRLTHEAAVKSAAVALEYSLRKARQAFPELDMEPATDEAAESTTQEEAEPSSP